MKITELARRYIARHLAAASAATISDLHTQVRTLQKYFDHISSLAGHEARPVEVGDLTDDLVAGCMAWLLTLPICPGREGRTVNTANKWFRNIRFLWRFAQEEDLLARRLKVKRYREPTIEPECWSLAELDRILHHAARVKGRVGDVPAGLFWLSLITFKYSTGVRISAVMKCPIKKLDLPAARVKIAAATQKQKADQVFDLIPQCVEALSQLRPERNARIFDDWPYDRRPASRWRALTQGLRRILRSAELPETSRDLWHKIRRTTITYTAAKAGKAAACEIAGHSHMSVTERYLDKSKLEHLSLRDILPQPNITIQLRLFQPDAPPETEAG